MSTPPVSPRAMKKARRDEPSSFPKRTQPTHTPVYYRTRSPRSQSPDCSSRMPEARVSPVVPEIEGWWIGPRRRLEVWGLATGSGPSSFWSSRTMAFCLRLRRGRIRGGWRTTSRTMLMKFVDIIEPIAEAALSNASDDELEKVVNKLTNRWWHGVVPVEKVFSVTMHRSY